ncbi:hypothetical protein CBOM_07781 [Ceraceosorus bombacis]|uniref:Uncharacterized protein n=1 Tax=Ceraceosorus bombacis TaxID=401625 RepID=A0A0N7LAW5_9BASI|nr:hypothetical protein CBOM_07781 [Ceraceosorus bombacis]
MPAKEDDSMMSGQSHSYMGHGVNFYKLQRDIHSVQRSSIDARALAVVQQLRADMPAQAQSLNVEQKAAHPVDASLMRTVLRLHASIII